MFNGVLLLGFYATIALSGTTAIDNKLEHSTHQKGLRSDPPEHSPPHTEKSAKHTEHSTAIATAPSYTAIAKRTQLWDEIDESIKEIREILEKLSVRGDIFEHGRLPPTIAPEEEIIKEALDYANHYSKALTHAGPSLLHSGNWDQQRFQLRVKKFDLEDLPTQQKYQAMASEMVYLLQLVEGAWGGGGTVTVESSKTHYPTTAEIKNELETYIKEVCRKQSAEVREIRETLKKLFVHGDIFEYGHHLYLATSPPVHIIKAALEYAYFYWMRLEVGDEHREPSFQPTSTTEHPLWILPGPSTKYDEIWDSESFQQRVGKFGWQDLPVRQQHHAMASELVKLVELVEHDLSSSGTELQRLSKLITTTDIKSGLKEIMAELEICEILQKLVVPSDTSKPLHSGSNSVSSPPIDIIKAALEYAYLYWKRLDVGDEHREPSFKTTTDRPIWHSLSINYDVIWDSESFHQRVDKFGWKDLPRRQQHHAMASELVKLVELVEHTGTGSVQKILATCLMATIDIKHGLEEKMVQLGTIQAKLSAEIRGILKKLFVQGDIFEHGVEFHPDTATPKSIIKAALEYAYGYSAALVVWETGARVVDNLYWGPKRFQQRVEKFSWSDQPPHQHYEAMATELVELLELVKGAWGSSDGRFKHVAPELSNYPTSDALRNQLNEKVENLHRCSFNDVKPQGRPADSSPMMGDGEESTQEIREIKKILGKLILASDSFKHGRPHRDSPPEELIEAAIEYASDYWIPKDVEAELTPFELGLHDLSLWDPKSFHQRVGKFKWGHLSDSNKYHAMARALLLLLELVEDTWPDELEQLKDKWSKMGNQSPYKPTGEIKTDLRGCDEALCSEHECGKSQS